MIKSNIQKYKNQLINEKSLYLKQHAHNPVNWLPWNEDNISKAIEQKKILLISIGYSACHWCHVMENESFMDVEIAKIINENFICIKIDREEYPSIDIIYMEAVQLINGNGGWPLNCFALSDGTPFWGGTYFPKNEWKELLLQIKELNEKYPERIIEQAKKVKLGIFNFNESLFITKSLKSKINLKENYRNIKIQLDNIYGGLKNAPKFPLPVAYNFLLYYYQIFKDDELYEHISKTLYNMGRGGIFDQIGGGFSRYSTDIYWYIPHFEKMLYDNALLISLYSKTYMIRKDNFFKEISDNCLNFLVEVLQNNNGLFYSSTDADTEGEEGKYYIWTEEELKQILQVNYDFFSNYFSIKKSGNWENNKNVLYVDSIKSEKIEKFDVDDKKNKILIDECKLKLKRIRDNRTKPLIDNKIIVSWNALMIKALIDRYVVFGNELDFKLAKNNAKVILNEFFIGEERLLRVNNKNIGAFLDDYAYLMDCLLNIYQIDSEIFWLDYINSLLKICFKKFYDENSGMFFYTSVNDKNIFFRTKEIIDNVMPSSNSVLFRVIYRMGLILSDSYLIEKSQKAINLMYDKIVKFPASYTNWLILSGEMDLVFYTIIVVGKKSKEFSREILSYNFSNILVINSEKENNLEIFRNKYVENETKIYICGIDKCYLSVDFPKEVIEYIKQNQK